MNFKIRKGEASHLFLYGAIILYFSYYFINNSYLRAVININSLAKIANIGTLVLLLCAIVIHKRISLKRLIVTTVLLVVCLFVSRFQESVYTFPIIVFFMLAGIGIDTNRVLRLSYRVNYFWLILICALAELGMIENKIGSSTAHASRVYFGFTAPVAPTLFFFTTLLYISYKKNSLKIWHYIIFFLIAFGFYRTVDVKAAFYFTCVLLVVSAIAKYCRVEIVGNKIISGISNMITPCVVIISFIAPYLYSKGNALMQAADVLTNGRIRLSATAFQLYGIQLFGQLMNYNYGLSGIYNNNADYFYLDSSYLKYLFMYGILFMLCVLVAYHFTLRKMIRDNNIQMFICISLSLGYFVFNPQMLYVPYNPFLLIILNSLVLLRNRRMKVE